MMQPPQKEWEEERVFSGSGWIFLKFNRPVYGFRPTLHLATFLSCHDLRFFCKLVYSVIVSFHDVFYALRVEKGISFFATPLFFFFFFFFSWWCRVLLCAGHKPTLLHPQVSISVSEDLPNFF